MSGPDQTANRTSEAVSLSERPSVPSMWKPTPLPLTDRRAPSPIERTFRDSVLPRYASSGLAGSWPASTSLRHKARTGAGAFAVIPSAEHSGKPFFGLRNSARMILGKSISSFRGLETARLLVDFVGILIWEMASKLSRWLPLCFPGLTRVVKIPVVIEFLRKVLLCARKQSGLISGWREQVGALVARSQMRPSWRLSCPKSAD